MREETADLVMPVLSYALNVYEQLAEGKSLDMDQVQAALKGLLDAGLNQRVWAEQGGGGAPGDDAFLGARFALACWLDELFTAGPWAERWTSRKLETALFGSTDRAWKFWEQAGHADGRLGGDALEVYLLCVQAGFRGCLRDKPEQLAEWVRNAQARVAAPAGAPPSPAEAGPGQPPPLRARRKWLDLVGRDPDAGDHPEVDAALTEAWQTLRQAGIDPATTPLYLAPGAPAGGDEAFFDAAHAGDRSGLRVRGVPHPGAPVRVFAAADAIYVTCPGAGLLSRQAKILTAGPDADAPPGRGDSLHAGRTVGGATIGVSGPVIRNTYRTLTGSAAPPRRGGRPFAGPAERRGMEAAEGRLRRLCRWLARRRSGAPLNGVLARLPAAALERDEDARHIGLACRRDLAVIREAARLHCPVFAVVCDMETVPGFTELAGQFPPDQRHGRLGQSHPWRPAAGQAGTVKAIEEGVNWLCEELLPARIHQSWRTEAPGDGDAEGAARANRRLLQLWCRMRERRRRLAALLASCAGGLGDESRGASWFGGWYLAATGADACRGQAFVAGAVRKLSERRQWLCWTREALEEDAVGRRWLLLAAAAAGAFALAAALAWLA